MLPVPEPGPRDLLVEVRAVSINPVGTKMRMRGGSDGEGAGLAASRELLASHGRELTLDESPLGGARVRLRFAPVRRGEPSVCVAARSRTA